MTPAQTERDRLKDPQDTNASIREIISRMRLGQLSPERVEAAARCGHKIASLVCPKIGTQHGEYRADKCWNNPANGTWTGYEYCKCDNCCLPGLDLLSQDETGKYLADCARRLLAEYEDRYPGDTRVRAAIEAARDGAENCDDIAGAAWQAGDERETPWCWIADAASQACHGMKEAAERIRWASDQLDKAGEIAWQRAKLGEYLMTAEL